ncbi:C2H2 type zinc finger protein [Stagonosporopsis vannaccii]|nr:C2H2 type zinc finger protein [Stagonosporopsis vannaccii]
MPEDYYTEEDALGSRSPGLQAIIVNPKPEEEPPPIVTQIFVSSPTSRNRKTSKLRKHRPTQGDWVLIREMDPNRPDIAHAVSQEALNSGSETESSDEEMQDATNSDRPAPATGKGMAAPMNDRSDSLADANPNFGLGPHATGRRESHASHASSTGSVLHSVTSNTSTSGSANGSAPNHTSPNAFTNGDHLSDPSAISPHLRGLRLSPSGGLPSEKLPSIHTHQPPPSSATSPESAASPSQQLPSIAQFDDLVRSANNDSEASGIFAHRQSISSSGQSPSAIIRSLSISSHHSPASPFPPFNASSPVSTASDAGRVGDVFLRSKEHLTLFAPGGARRPSQIADGVFPRSASISVETYNSPVGHGTDMLQTPIEGGRQRVLSIDGAMTSRHLPPPIGSGLTNVPQNVAGTYKCEEPGCTALPFQTQYLLNSHANVHSQTRPHFCPVKGCPRSEGGKGFKRKNEMIRHGLVHQSPGYVCPFCPDREHKYPRPDNLQRHVRVHHVDKDKDDPQLRDVLAQRPEGGSRGRRRRVS